MLPLQHSPLDLLWLHDFSFLQWIVVFPTCVPWLLLLHLSKMTLDFPPHSRLYTSHRSFIFIFQLKHHFHPEGFLNPSGYSSANTMFFLCSSDVDQTQRSFLGFSLLRIHALFTWFSFPLFDTWKAGMKIGHLNLTFLGTKTLSGETQDGEWILLINTSPGNPREPWIGPWFSRWIPSAPLHQRPQYSDFPAVLWATSRHSKKFLFESNELQLISITTNTS